ncbi:MAG: hypothetical protein Q9N34_06955 [Aquificota bacterium]|nr:hypothetical protein [Aquificota bacterium]
MFPSKALLAETFVEKIDGQWVVFVEVIFEDETVRREVGRYFTEEQARIAANYIRRNINRDIPFPPDGLEVAVECGKFETVEPQSLGLLPSLTLSPPFHPYGNGIELYRIL